MSETDAVRPTGETGATCPWCGSEMRSIPFPTSWAARCTNPKCYAIGPQHRENPFDALAAAARPREQLGPRMPWSDMSGSEKEAVYNNAPRPLRDFPAVEFPECAPGPWLAGEVPGEIGRPMMVITSSDRRIIIDMGAADVNSEDEIPLRDFILSRVNAVPARPAAAGLTENEIEDCVYVGMKLLAPDPEAPELYGEIEKRIRAGVRHAVILSSRATGEEAEIPRCCYCQSPVGVIEAAIHMGQSVWAHEPCWNDKHTIRGGGE